MITNIFSILSGVNTAAQDFKERKSQKHGESAGIMLGTKSLQVWRENLSPTTTIVLHDNAENFGALFNTGGGRVILYYTYTLANIVQLIEKFGGAHSEHENVDKKKYLCWSDEYSEEHFDEVLKFLAEEVHSVEKKPETKLEIKHGSLEKPIEVIPVSHGRVVKTDSSDMHEIFAEEDSNKEQVATAPTMEIQIPDFLKRANRPVEEVHHERAHISPIRPHRGYDDEDAEEVADFGHPADIEDTNELSFDYDDDDYEDEDRDEEDSKKEKGLFARWFR